MDHLDKSRKVDHVVEHLGNYLVYLSPRAEDSITVLNDRKGTVRIIRSSDLRFTYTVAELVEQIGEPEYIYFKSSEVRNNSCPERWDSESKRYESKFLLYPQKGMLFHTYTRLSEYDLLCPDMLVASFCYFPSMRLEDFLNDQVLANVCAGKVESSDLTKWHGFGGGY